MKTPFLVALVVVFTLSVGGLMAAPAPSVSINLASKPDVKNASAAQLAAAVKAQVLAARAKAADPKAADAATEAIVKSAFSNLAKGDQAKAEAILAALASIPGVNFVRLATVAAEAQPLLTRAIARIGQLLDPGQAAALLAALSNSNIINKSFGTGPGSSTVSANVASLTGTVQSNEQ